MPLPEFYRMMSKGKMEAPQQNSTDFCYMPDDEFVELVWDKGQIMMQGQSSRGRKAPVSNNFQMHTPKTREREKIGKFVAMEPFMSMPMSGDMGLAQDDDLVPWFNYPLDDTLEQDYCSDFLPEISGATANEPPARNGSTLMDRREGFNQIDRTSHNVSAHHVASLDQHHSSKVSRSAHIFPSSSHQLQIPEPSLRSEVSDVVCGDPVLGRVSAGQMAHAKMPKQDNGLLGGSSTLLNFSHFSRPVAIARANIQNCGAMAGAGSSNVETFTMNEKRSLATSSIPTEMGMRIHSQSSLVSEKGDPKALAAKTLEESQPDAVRRKDSEKASDLAIDANAPNGILEGEKNVDPVGASSSVCSGNSGERASNDMRKKLKRKSLENEDFECQSKDVEQEPVKKAAPARGGTGSKRSRAAEVHNLSERRRRDRINEKMRALQELIPNCNKVDKASMLDEAIEYLKTLQLQVQIMSMGAGLCMPTMMFPNGMPHMRAAGLPHFPPMGVGMGAGMGFGMGMLDMNHGPQGRPMIPFAPVQGAQYPSPSVYGLSGYQGIPGPNHQVFGQSGQGIPMLFPQPAIAAGRPPMNTDARLNTLKVGAQVEVPNAVPSINSKDLIQNTDSQVISKGDTSTSMNPTASQLRATNENFDQLSMAKNDRAPDVGGCGQQQS